MSRGGGGCGRLLCEPCFKARTGAKSHWRRVAILTTPLLVSGVHSIVAAPQRTAGKLGRSDLETSV